MMLKKIVAGLAIAYGAVWIIAAIIVSISSATVIAFSNVELISMIFNGLLYLFAGYLLYQEIKNNENLKQAMQK